MTGEKTPFRFWPGGVEKKWKKCCWMGTKPKPD